LQAIGISILPAFS